MRQGWTRSFHSFCSGRKVWQGLKTWTKAKPGCWMASTSNWVRALGSPEKPRAMKLAPAARAMAAGWNRRTPVPWGVSLLWTQSGWVVGEAWPLVMP
jgi:hypothetical protein